MRSILFISLMNGDAWGGSEEIWYQTAIYAADNGYKVGCAFHEWPHKQKRIERLQAAGCTLYLFSNKGRQKRTLIERLQYKITKRKVRKFASQLPFADYDLTVINQGYIEVVSHHWKGLYRYVKNYVLLFHAHNEKEEIKSKEKPLLKNWVLNARKNLFASERTKLFLEKQLSMPIPGADVLINPLSFSAPTNSFPYLPLQDGNYIFVMLATLDVRRKAQDNLITVLSSQKWKERNWRLHLYGTGVSEEQIKALIKKHALEEKVILKGYHNNMKGALNESHLLLQMTHIDAMPLAVIEAMAMARPIVVSDVGDMPKWVNEDENGWISKDATTTAIDNTLEKAWQQRLKWATMGENSFRIFSAKFPAIPERFFLQQLNR